MFDVINSHFHVAHGKLYPLHMKMKAKVGSWNLFFLFSILSRLSGTSGRERECVKKHTEKGSENEEKEMGKLLNFFFLFSTFPAPPQPAGLPSFSRDLVFPNFSFSFNFFLSHHIVQISTFHIQPTWWGRRKERKEKRKLMQITQHIREKSRDLRQDIVCVIVCNQNIKKSLSSTFFLSLSPTTIFIVLMLPFLHPSIRIHGMFSTSFSLFLPRPCWLNSRLTHTQTHMLFRYVNLSLSDLILYWAMSHNDDDDDTNRTFVLLLKNEWENKAPWNIPLIDEYMRHRKTSPSLPAGCWRVMWYCK